MSSDLPGFSIVVTCYNLERYIAESLSSVLNQDYPGDYEIIVVDDCSTDCSVEIIKQTIKEKGVGKDVVLIRNEVNLGVAGAMDVGLRHARYEWILEADGDDVQLPDRCSKTAALVRKYPDAGFIIMSHSLIDAEGRSYGQRLVVDEGEEYCAASPEDRMAIYLGKSGYYPVKRGAFGCSMSFSRRLAERWGALTCSDAGRFAQDPPWELRAFLSSPVVWSNQLACKYRSHSSNILNWERKRDCFSDYLKLERENCAYAGKELMALNQMQKDLLRSMSTPGLSDWSVAGKEQCFQFLQQLISIMTTRHSWWSYPFYKRVTLACKMAGNVPMELKSWYKIRILPLYAVVALKWLLKK